MLFTEAGINYSYITDSDMVVITIPGLQLRTPTGRTELHREMEPELSKELSARIRGILSGEYPSMATCEEGDQTPIKVHHTHVSCKCIDLYCFEGSS